jgi:hypothetical protein
MIRRSIGVAVVAVLVLAMTACGDNGGKAADKARDAASTVVSEVRGAATTAVSRIEGATRLKATLSGTAEVPGPGDTDGAGTATIDLDVSKTEVCYEVTAQKIDKPTAMHIHEGEVGKSGGIVITLNTPTASDTTTKGCANADAALIGRIAAKPGSFYVNVHTQAFPNGAVRGQLSQ